MATNRRRTPPTIVSNQAPIRAGAVTFTNLPQELVKKYRSSRPLRRPHPKKSK